MSSQKRKPPFPILTAAAGILLLAAALALGWAQNAGSPAGDQASLQAGTNANASADAIERVSLEDAKAAFDSGAAVFLDVRSAGQYAESHIAGALNVPLNELPDRLETLRGANWIITYCT